MLKMLVGVILAASCMKAQHHHGVKKEAVQLAKQLIELLMNCNIKQSALNYSVNKTISS